MSTARQSHISILPELVTQSSIYPAEERVLPYFGLVMDANVCLLPDESSVQLDV